MFHLSKNHVSPGGKSLSITFFLKELKTTQCEWAIMGRLIYDRRKVEFATGIRIHESTWCPKKQESKNSSIINKKLIGIRSMINDAKIMLEQEGNFFTVQDIKKMVFDGVKGKPTVLSYCKKFLDEKLKSGECTPSTLSKYPPTFSYLEKYLMLTKMQSIRIDQWTKSNVLGFDSFLKEQSINDKGAKMTLTTVNKHHVKLKTLFNHAVHNLLILGNPYNGIKLKFPYKRRGYLSSYELSLLEELDLSNNKSLSKARDLFVFSCYTGLRFQDAQDLKMSHLSVIKDQVFIQMTQGKTQESVEVPVLEPAMQILRRYTDLPERIVNNKALPQMSNQKANYFLKAIAEIAGIDKVLTHHMARHTCATTVLLDNTVPIEVVSKFLGHNSIRTTQIYGKVTHQQLQKVVELVK